MARNRSLLDIKKAYEPPKLVRYCVMYKAPSLELFLGKKQVMSAYGALRTDSLAQRPMLPIAIVLQNFRSAMLAACRATIFLAC